MLDKRTTKFLSSLAKICDDGSYKIVEKAELAKLMGIRGNDFAAIDQMVRYLQDNETVDVKYADETVYCLTVLPKGRVTSEGLRRKHRDVQGLSRKNMIILVACCFAAAVVGSIIGVLFTRLF